VGVRVDFAIHSYMSYMSFKRLFVPKIAPISGSNPNKSGREYNVLCKGGFKLCTENDSSQFLFFLRLGCFLLALYYVCSHVIMVIIGLDHRNNYHVRADMD
jgi:hypothetical protein